MIKKYNLTKETLQSIKTTYYHRGSGKDSTTGVTSMLWYRCKEAKCWVMELFWFIDKLEGQCKSCSWFNKD